MSRFARTVLLATGTLCFAGAAQAQGLTVPYETLPELATPKVVTNAVPVAPPFAHDHSRGDLATYWVSPMLQNHDSKVSGVTYKVEGKTQFSKFGFSVVNPSAELIDVVITCQDKTGTAMPKYDAVLPVAPNGAAMWSAASIAPTRSTDLLTKDMDHVWCSLMATRPFAAFGTMSLSENGTGHGGTSAINLVAVAR